MFCHRISLLLLSMAALWIWRIHFRRKVVSWSWSRGKDILQAYVPWSEPFDSKPGESTVLSSGGLMASYVVEHECFRVFNPFILGEQVNVANPLDHQAFDHVPNSFFFKSWGFGYCPSSKEFKIFKLLVGRKTIKGQVYTINGADRDDRRSWRTITFSDCCPSHLTDHDYTVECKATLYWKAKPHVVVRMLINYLRPHAASLVSPSRIMATATKTWWLSTSWSVLFLNFLLDYELSFGLILLFWLRSACP